VPARTTTPAGTAPDAGSAGLWLWDVLFVFAAVITAGFVAATGGPPAEVGAAAVLVLALGAAWLVVGKRLAAAQTAPGSPAVLGYAALLVAALVAAVLLVPESTWALFAVLPQLFWLVRLAPAIAATVVLTVGLPMLAGLRGGATLDDAVRLLGPQALLMTAFGVLVGTWIHRVTEESTERARLIEELEASRAREAELSHHAGAAAERERLAGEIHDTLAQGFTSIVTLLQAAQAEFGPDPDAARRHIDLAVRSAKENLQEARHLVAATAPAPLATRSLADAVGRQAARFAEETGTDTAHGASGEPRRLPAEQEILLLRAAQELLANVARHAAAHTVTVRLDFRDPDAVALTVADDGSGFEPDAVPGGHYGLAMLQTRTERLGGALSLSTGPGEGTTATVTLPTGSHP
jgi:signal transduction histidine kinase